MTHSKDTDSAKYWHGIMCKQGSDALRFSEELTMEEAVLMNLRQTEDDSSSILAFYLQMPLQPSREHGRQ